MAITLRLTPDQDRALGVLARAQHSSKHEAAVRAIVATAARLLSDERVAQLAREMLPEYARAEERLAAERRR